MARALFGALAAVSSDAADTCPPMMPTLNCFGGTYNSVGNVTSPGECCELCSEDPDCGAFAHHGSSAKCNLKASCEVLMQDHTNSSYTAGLPEKLPPAPAPSCAVPSSSMGHRCTGEALGSSNVTDLGDCCDLCMATTGCQVYSYSNHTCNLYRSCAHHHSDGNWTSGWAPPPQPARSVSYRVGRGSFNVSGYACGPENATETVIFYPKGPGPFHAVVYGHGDWGAIDGCDAWLETVSSRGLVVIAPFAGKNDTDGCGSHFVKDILLALNESKLSAMQGQEPLHPALASVDWTSVGLFGHSRGAKYVIPAARLALAAGENITAVLASADVPQHLYDLDVPLMFTTGSKDIGNTNDSILEYFGNVTTTPRIYASLQDAYHMEVQEGMRLNAYTASFLACHVSGQQEDCDLVYGADSLCAAHDYELCQVETADAVMLV